MHLFDSYNLFLAALRAAPRPGAARPGGGRAKPRPLTSPASGSTTPDRARSKSPPAETASAAAWSGSRTPPQIQERQADLRHPDSGRPAKAGRNAWEAGWIYNPEDEERFSAALELTNANTLSHRLSRHQAARRDLHLEARGHDAGALRTGQAADLARTIAQRPLRNHSTAAPPATWWASRPWRQPVVSTQLTKLACARPRCGAAGRA